MQEFSATGTYEGQTGSPGGCNSSAPINVSIDKSGNRWTVMAAGTASRNFLPPARTKASSERAVAMGNWILQSISHRFKRQHVGTDWANNRVWNSPPPVHTNPSLDRPVPGIGIQCVRRVSLSPASGRPANISSSSYPNTGRGTMRRVGSISTILTISLCLPQNLRDMPAPQ